MERSRSGINKIEVSSSSNSTSPPIQREEGGQLLNVEDEVWDRHGDEGTLPSLSTWILCRTSHKRENGVRPDGRCRKETAWHCKNESKGDDATCSVFQQCFTFEQVKLQTTQGQDQLANQKGPPYHARNSEGILAGKHHGQNENGACTGKIEARAQEGPTWFAKQVRINWMPILIGAQWIKEESSDSAIEGNSIVKHYCNYINDLLQEY